MIRFPRNTEKSIRMMESSNKLVFVVDKDDTKTQIREQIEKQFNVKVTKINTTTTLTGVKKAIVTFSPENPAIDIATKLGMM